jgi:uncharacterized protein (TIGR04255 family)
MTYELETSTFPTLGKAPITEALIDIRATLPADTSLAALEGYTRGIEDVYPKADKRYSLEARFEFDSPQPRVTMPPSTPDGFLFRARDESSVVQARMDGFTFSKLKPYEDWKTFSGAAKELWARYVGVVSPIRATRVAVRYLNRIELPVGVNIGDYLKTVPQIASGIPQDLGSFLMRLVIPDAASGCVAILTETTVPDQSSTVYPVILDIDVFREIKLDPSDPQLWTILEQLRNFKNTIFFRTLTELALESYK